MRCEGRKRIPINSAVKLRLCYVNTIPFRFRRSFSGFLSGYMTRIQLSDDYFRRPSGGGRHRDRKMRRLLKL